MLVVDDELNITELVSLALRYEGFDVSSARDGRGALRAVREFRPELMILDVTMPDIDGLEVVRRMRAENIWTPVIFLTARDAIEDKVAGLTVGGDDYLTKPFSLDELIARVRAMVRRNNLAARQASSGVLQYADLVLDEDRLEVARGARQISLTPTEFRLLRFLMLNAGRVRVEGADSRSRVGVRLRGRWQRRGDVHQLPAQEGRSGAAAADPDGARVRVHAPFDAGLMSLRARLLSGVLVMTAVGLLAAGGGTYLALRSFLLGPRRSATDGGSSGGRSRPAPVATSTIDTMTLDLVAPPIAFVEVRDAAGRVVALHVPSSLSGSSPTPRLPAVLHPPPAPRAGVPSRERALQFDAPAVSGTGRYRVLVSSLPASGGVLIVAVSLDDVNATLQRLLRVELLIAAGLLAVLAMAAFWLLRRGLRPLERISEVAGTIAQGDLDVRVSPAEERSEIGRLGLALNGMLERLEDAFARRDRSEAQLRRFVSSASHELRTPLTSIRGYAALLRRGARHNPEDLETSISRIESEATRMAGLIDDLLLLARLDEQRPLDADPDRSGGDRASKRPTMRGRGTRTGRSPSTSPVRCS